MVGLAVYMAVQQISKSSNALDIVQLLVVVVAVGGLVISVVTLLHTRKKDDAEIRVEQRVGEFDELARMNGLLRSGLSDAQTQASLIRDDLDLARRDLDRVNAGLTVALANVALLNDFIEEHVPPEIPRPRLRRMPI